MTMMLDAILPALAALPRPGPGQQGSQLADGERPAFAQLLSQAGAQLNDQPLQALAPQWTTEGDPGNRSLLAQLIAENNGFAARTALDPVAGEPTESGGIELAADVLPGVDSDLIKEAPEADAGLTPAAEVAGNEQDVIDNPFAAIPAEAVAVPTSREYPAGDSRPLAPESAARPELTQSLADAGAGKPAVKAGTVEQAPVVTTTASDTSMQPQVTTTVQPIQTAGATSPAAAAQAPALNAPVATPEWNRELGQQVVMATRGDEQRVSIRLNPVDLGPLQVELKVVDQQAHVQFLSSHAQVRGAVEQAIPQLREALAEQGITLADTSVGEQRENRQNTASGQGRDGGDQHLAESLSDEATATAEATQVPADGRVNVYV